MSTIEQEPSEIYIDPATVKIQQLQERQKWHKSREYGYGGLAGFAVASAIAIVGLAVEGGVDNVHTLGGIMSFDSILVYTGVVSTLASMSHGRQADTIDTVLMTHDLQQLSIQTDTMPDQVQL